MDLKRTIPKEIKEKLNITTYLYAVSFDVFDQHYVDGLLIVDSSSLYVVLKNQCVKQYLLSSFDDIGIEKTSQGGYLYLRQKQKNLIVVEFTNHCYDKIAAIALGVKLYMQEHFVSENLMSERNCPICGTRYENGVNYCEYCHKQKGVFKMFLPYFLKYKWWILFQSMFLLLNIILNTLSPSVYQKIIDDYIKAHVFNNGFVLLIMAIVGIFLYKTLSEIIRGMIYPKVSMGIVHDLRLKVYDKVQHLSLNSANKKTTGGLISRISDDIETIASFLCDNLVNFVYHIVQIVIVLIIVFSQDIKLSLLVIFPIPLVEFLVVKLWRAISKKYEIRWKYVCNLNNILHDVLNGIKVVKSYGMEEKEIQRVEKANKKQKDIDATTEKTWSTFYPIIYVLLSFSQIFIYYYIGVMIIDGQQMSVGDMIKWVAYSSMLYNSFSGISNMFQSFSRFTISANKVNDILLEKTIEEVGASISQSQVKGEVIFDHVRFGYISFTPVLKDISFHVKSGETIGIVGYSGSGKTTLVNLLMKLYEPNNGHIYVDGIDIATLDSFQYRKLLGVVLQETLLFSGTIYENIIYGNEKATMQEVIEVCKMANAHDFILQKEFGYDTPLGKNGEGLSGGEKQRIAIARALLANPSIFIFDEATSSLDTVTEKQIQDSINQISQNKTTFIIAHRLSTLKNADRLIVLKQGKMVEFGTHQELIAQKGYYYSLVLAQYMNYEKQNDEIKVQG